MNDKKIIGVDLSLDQEYIARSVEDIVKAGIVQALGDPSEIVTKALNNILNMKVDREGRPSTGWDSKPYLDYIATKTVTNTVRNCIEKYIQEHIDTFEKEIIRQLSSKRFARETAEAFIQTMLKMTKDQYSKPQINISFKKG